jgi:hypothetical protein
MPPIPQDPAETPTLISRAWYTAAVRDFLEANPSGIIGELTTRCENHHLIETQRAAWREEIALLQRELNGLLDGTLYLEFNIPRMGRRIDCVLLLGPALFVIEFKIGEAEFHRADLDQAWDYALDLKNFHEASHHAPIIPLLVITGDGDLPGGHPSSANTMETGSSSLRRNDAPRAERSSSITQGDQSDNKLSRSRKASPPVQLVHDADFVFHPIGLHVFQLRSTIEHAVLSLSGKTLRAEMWSTAPYRPTPTILEAARALYAQHNVEEIARHDAGAQNLGITSRRVEDLIEEARAHRRKLICFITGVPGAGKTLVGLNVATRHRRDDEPTHAVFLSGNGPLVAVLHEALTRDEVARQKAIGNIVRKNRVRESVKAFIQIVHHFRDEALRDSGPPSEHVAIFDEAQRAWNLEQTRNFMRRKKGVESFSQSEPEFLISYMDRHTDWSVIVCLVGGGQEINVGELGIDAWIDAIRTKFPHWQMVISSHLTDTEYAAGQVLQLIRQRENTRFDDYLHLAVSLRSFRAENVSAFVKAVLDCEESAARQAYALLADRFPIVVTRNLKAARDWIRSKARGSERYGLVASSKAQRLKPHAIDIRVEVNPVHYFLNGKADTRSSYYLEDAATEFQVQGLELDWVCVTWDGDLRFTGNTWSYHDFRGDRWTNIHKTENQRYLKNAYRVLLTRARQGMVIFIPPGDEQDPTRARDYYDPTCNYLTSLGVPVI